MGSDDYLRSLIFNHYIRSGYGVCHKSHIISSTCLGLIACSVALRSQPQPLAPNPCAEGASMHPARATAHR
jgi:hypothetical protein